MDTLVEFRRGKDSRKPSALSKKGPSIIQNLFKVRSRAGPNKASIASTASNQAAVGGRLVPNDPASAVLPGSQPISLLSVETNTGDIARDDVCQSHSLEQHNAEQRDRWEYLQVLASRPVEPKATILDFEAMEKGESSFLCSEGNISLFGLEFDDRATSLRARVAVMKTSHPTQAKLRR